MNGSPIGPASFREMTGISASYNRGVPDALTVMPRRGRRDHSRIPCLSPEIGGVDEGGARRVKFGDEGLLRLLGGPWLEKTRSQNEALRLQWLPVIGAPESKDSEDSCHGQRQISTNKTQTLFAKCCRLPCPAHRVRLRGDFSFGGITL